MEMCHLGYKTLHSGQQMQEEGSVWHFPHRGRPQARNCDPQEEIALS